MSDIIIETEYQIGFCKKCDCYRKLTTKYADDNRGHILWICSKCGCVISDN